MVYLKVVSWHSPRDPGKLQNNLSGHPEACPTFKLGISQM